MKIKIEKRLTTFEIMNIKLTNVNESLYNCIQLYFILNIKAQLRRQNKSQEFNIVTFNIDEFTNDNCRAIMEIEF